MWTPTKKDFEIIKGWGLDKNPFAAVSDFSPLKAELRWLNPEHRQIYIDYINKRLEYLKGKNFDYYYKKAEKPIDRLRWEYLMVRKAWFIMPLGWEKAAMQSCKVADFGCGDGDNIQRLINFIDQKWQEKKIKNNKTHIVGIDLNPSRIENAKKYVSSKNPRITFEFKVCDIVSNGLAYKDGYFDFSLCCGVLEILEDLPCGRFLDEMCRVTRRGIYIYDVFEKFPGSYPRDNLEKLLLDRGFKTQKKHIILQGPFSIDKIQDPMKIWPNSLVQNIWLEHI